MKKQWSIKNLDELDIFAQQFLTQLRSQASQLGATVVTLTGDLGAGKTTLTQMIGKHLGITEPINSPTFVITKYYDLKNQSWQRLIHIDAYRLDGENLDVMGFDELFTDPTNLVVIEWPTYIESKLPDHRTNISISLFDTDKRNLTIT